MKPINLKFSGLNSFIKPQEIDFNKLTTGVFGIFGKTGSGKTTILDAIMLALYGQISKTTKATDFINSKCEETDVELIFQTGEAKKYFVHRRYKKKKSDATISYAWFGQIEGENKLTLAEGTRDVDAYIKEIVGLSYNEFSKCIALPQGEFAGFLQATAGERTEIISNIFSLQDFGDRLLDKVKAEYGQYETRKQVLEAQKAMLKDVKKEDIEETQKVIEQKQKEVDAFIKERETVELVYQEQQKVVELTEKKKKLVHYLEDLYKQKGLFFEKNRNLEKYKNASIIESEINSLERLTKETAALKEEVLKLSEQKVVALNNYNEFISMNEGFESHYQENLIRLTQKEALLISAVEDEMVIMSLKTTAQSLMEDIEEIKKKIEEKEKCVSLDEKELVSIKDDLDKKTKELELLEQDESLGLTLKEIQDIESEIIIYQTLENQVEKLLDKTKEDLSFYEQQYSYLIRNEKDISDKLAKENLKIADVLEDFSGVLMSLQEKQELLARLNNAKQEIEFIDSLILEKINKINKYKGRIDEIVSQVQGMNLGDREVGKNKEYNRLEVEKEVLYGLIDDGNNEILNLESAKNRLYQQFVDLTKNKEDELINLIENTKKSVLELLEFIDARGEERIDLINIEKQKIEFGTRILVNKENIQELLDLLFGLQRFRAEHELTIYNAREQLSQRKGVDANYNVSELIKQKETEIKELLYKQSELVMSFSNKQVEMQAEITKLQSVEEKLNNINAQIKEKEDSYYKVVLNNVGATTILKQTRDNIRDMSERKEYNKQKSDKLRVALETENQNFQTRSVLLDQKAKELSDMSFVINGKIFDLGFKDIDDAKSCFVSQGVIESLEKEVQGYNQSLLLTEKELETINEQLKDKYVDFEQFKKMEEDIKNLFSKISEEQVLLGTLLTVQKNQKEDYESLCKINKELPDVISKIDDAKELLSLLRGKALVEYIAEEYMVEITNNASKKLNMLLDGRYELEFKDGSFAVYDNFNDRKPRAVQTLSGGETFLVSLSLALAMSEIISLSSNKSMEFFFLDEGFGTLDSELVENVISALYKLESHNLKIGLISHVRELEEEIKNKIIVDSATETEGSSLRIINAI